MIYPGECSTYTWEECLFCYLFWSVSFYLAYHVVYDQCFLMDFLYGSIHWWKWSIQVLTLSYPISPLTSKPSVCKPKMWTCIWSPAREQKVCCQHHAWVKLQLPSVSYCWWFFSSTVSTFLPLLVTLLAWFQPLYARCCTVLLYYCTFKILYYKILNVFFTFCAGFLGIIGWNYYTTIRVLYSLVLVEYLG